jgi:spore germination cell wall hydrolase CwlJ-like protein
LAGLLVFLGAVAAVASARVGLGAEGRAKQIAETTQGDFSNVGLTRLGASMDPAALGIARRYDPALQQPLQPGLWVDATSGSYDAPPEFKLRDLSPQQAMLVNASMPISILPNSAAKPFELAASSPAEEGHALQCLSAAVYYEAASQDDDGEAAVAQVVLNRLRHPLFPKTVCGVVFQGSQKTTGCQFTFTCDGSLNRAPSGEGWARAERIAARALHGYVFKPVGEATHYHTMWVVPYWSPTLVKLTQVGAHIFYRWSGSGGLPGAFSMAYAGGEGDAWAMAAAKLGKVSEPVVALAQPLLVQDAETVKLQSSPMTLASNDAPTALVRSRALPAAAALSLQTQTAPVMTVDGQRATPRIPVPTGW